MLWKVSGYMSFWRDHAKWDWKHVETYLSYFSQSSTLRHKLSSYVKFPLRFILSIIEQEESPVQAQTQDNCKLLQFYMIWCETQVVGTIEVHWLFTLPKNFTLLICIDIFIMSFLLFTWIYRSLIEMLRFTIHFYCQIQ